MPAPAQQQRQPPQQEPSDYTDYNQLSINSIESVRSVSSGRRMPPQPAPIPSGRGPELEMMSKIRSVAFTSAELEGIVGQGAGDEDAIEAAARRKRARRRAQRGAAASIIPPASACVYPVARFVSRVKRLLRGARRAPPPPPSDNEGIGEPAGPLGRRRAEWERERRLSDTEVLGLSQSGASSASASAFAPSAITTTTIERAHQTYPAAVWGQHAVGSGGSSSSDLAAAAAYSTLPRPLSRQRSGEAASSSSGPFRPFASTSASASGREEAKSQGDGAAAVAGRPVRPTAGAAASSSSSAASSSSSNGDGHSSSPEGNGGEKGRLWEAGLDLGSDEEEGKEEDEQQLSGIFKLHRQISV